MEKKMAPGDRKWNEVLPLIGIFLSTAGLLSGVIWVMLLCTAISVSLDIISFTATIVSWQDDHLYCEVKEQRNQLEREKKDLERELRCMQRSLSTQTEYIDRLEKANTALRSEAMELQWKLHWARFNNPFSK